MPVDADHGSDETTRKSMSCHHRYLGHCLIETQSARQATVALSSGESEFYALNLGCVAGMLVIRFLKGMQLEHLTLTGRPEIYSDDEVWVGQIKHMDT